MATAQKQRSDQIQASCGWAALFPSEINTQPQSLVFVKRMMAVAVSCITYLRGIFPEDAYRARYLEDLCIKILREDSSCSGASKIVRWMKGCFDALEKGYLQIMVLGVHTDRDDPNSMIESYQLKVKYTLEGPRLDIVSNVKSIATSITTEDTKKASVSLIRKLFVLMQNLDSLSDDVSLTMKLFYYDDVTPPDYQPPGFKEGESDEMWFEGVPVHIKVGNIQTPFHMLKVRVTTEQQRMRRVEEEDILNASTHKEEKQVPEQEESMMDIDSIIEQEEIAEMNSGLLEPKNRKIQEECDADKELKQLSVKADKLSVSGKKNRRKKTGVNRDSVKVSGTPFQRRMTRKRRKNEE